MNTELKMRIAGVLIVAVIFISGLGIGPSRRTPEVFAIDHDIGTLQYEVGIHDKLLDRYGEKIESIDQRTIRLESAVDGLNSKMAWFNGLFAACLLAVFGALGGTVYRRVVDRRTQGNFDPKVK